MIRIPPWQLAVFVYVLSPLHNAMASEPSALECVEAFEQTQRLRRDGKLLEALEKAVICGGPTCPGPMQADCQAWHQDVKAALPTVVVDVKDSEGAHVPGAKLQVDDNEGDAELGPAIALNPGLHELRIEAPGFKTRSESVLLVEGEQRRRVVFRMIRADDSAVAKDTKPDEQWSNSSWSSIPVLSALGVGVVGLGAFAYWGLDTRSRDKALDDCWGSCSAERLERVQRGYLFANVSLGVGLAGIASGVLLATVFGADEASATSVQASSQGLAVTTGGTF